MDTQRSGMTTIREHKGPAHRRRSYSCRDYTEMAYRHWSLNGFVNRRRHVDAAFGWLAYQKTVESFIALIKNWTNKVWREN